MPENLNKKQNYVHFNDGFYGNKLRTWDSYDLLRLDPSVERVVMRYKGAAGGANYEKYGQHVSLTEVETLIFKWVDQGADIRNIVFGEAAPDEYLTIQGEVVESTEHLSLYYCHDKTTMRKALASPNAKHAQGLTAKLLLQHYLSPSSHEDVKELLDLFPDHVIEFSAYSRNLGSCKGRNTIIWEVRKY